MPFFATKDVSKIVIYLYNFAVKSPTIWSKHFPKKEPPALPTLAVWKSGVWVD